jgi:cytochrome c biogenesis protein CcdA
MGDTARILLYGLIAAASPTTLLAVLVVLLSKRGRANGLAFAAGFLFGYVAAFLTAFFVGSTISEQHHGSVRSYAELVLGVVLIAVGWRGRRCSRSSSTFDPPSPSRSASRSVSGRSA